MRYIPFLVAGLVVSALLCSPATSHAAKKDSSFDSWLKQYEAWDVLESHLAATGASEGALGNATESATVSMDKRYLERARAFISLGQPRQALKLLSPLEPFADISSEYSRLALIGDSNRRIGRLDEAVDWYSRAGEILEQPEMVKKLSSIKGLAAVWVDVWRERFWKYSAAPDASPELKPLLEKTMIQGQVIWPRVSFWSKASLAWNALAEGKDNTSFPYSVLNVTGSDQRIMAKAFAAMSLGRWQTAQNKVDSVSSNEIKGFFTLFINTLQAEGKIDLKRIPANCTKARTFWKGGYRALEPFEVSQWVISDPETPAWPVFRDKLMKMKPGEALTTIEGELKSSLIGENTIESLRQMAVATAVLDGDFKAFEEDRVGSPVMLPLSLRMTALLLTDRKPADLVLTGEQDGRALALLETLGKVLGKTPTPAWEVPFWSQITDVTKASQSYPLDSLLLLADWDAKWHQKSSIQAAKRMSYLFPDTEQGTRATLFLADSAAQQASFKTTALYLNRINPATLGEKAWADYLQARARLEVQLGRSNQALKTYAELMKVDNTRLSASKKLRLALLAQQNGQLQWAQKLFAELWATKDTLDPAVQAEVLFWMAETDQALKRNEDALSKYLNLAWKYPEQNIWATTAMYRASLIYEQMGRYATARKLLKSVVKQADTKKQKQAAETRIKAIDSKMTKISKAKKEQKADWKYPF